MNQNNNKTFSHGQPPVRSVICSLCRGDHTYEEHMQTERDIASMPHPSKTRHLLSSDNGSGKMSATWNGESELDRAWRTIPAECRGGTPTQERPILTHPVTLLRTLVTPANIVTVIVTATMIAVITALMLALFLDWKMP